MCLFQVDHRGKLVKSRSLDESTIDLRRQLEAVEQEAQVLKDKVEDLDRQNDKLIKDNRRLQLMAGRKVSAELNHYNQQLQLVTGKMLRINSTITTRGSS